MSIARQLLGLAPVLVLALGPAPDSHRNSARFEGLRATTTMGAARAAHSATALHDGRVLVVGGFTNDENAMLGAEIYDARSGRFSTLPRPVTLRHSHTATLLPDGRVLIAGGYGAGNTPVASAELFDPATNTFTATGSMLAARSGQTAVPLANGKVLLAGGVGPGWTFLASAELYDPATGRFTAAGNMTVPRESHVALRLQDGRVLVVGGHSGRRSNVTLYTSAEVYDAATGRFTRIGDMGIRRHKHDGVLLRDGRVLITGGTDERDFDGIYSSSELFDPRTNTFVPGPAMTRPRYKHNGSSLLLPDGKVLIGGGAPEAETFDPIRQRFTRVTAEVQMAGQFSAAAALPAGRVIITGGYGNGTGPRASAWLYNP